MSQIPNTVQGFLRVPVPNTRRHAKTSKRNRPLVISDERYSISEEFKNEDENVMENNFKLNRKNRIGRDEDDNSYNSKNSKNSKKSDLNLKLSESQEFLASLRKKEFPYRRKYNPSLHSSNTRYVKHSENSMEDRNTTGMGTTWIAR